MATPTGRAASGGTASPTPLGRFTAAVRRTLSQRYKLSERAANDLVANLGHTVQAAHSSGMTAASGTLALMTAAAELYPVTCRALDGALRTLEGMRPGGDFEPAVVAATIAVGRACVPADPAAMPTPAANLAPPPPPPTVGRPVSPAAAKLAVSVLEPFRENSAYNDYQEADGWTDDQYDVAVAELAIAAAQGTGEEPPGTRVGDRVVTLKEEPYEDDGERVMPAGAVGRIDAVSTVTGTRTVTFPAAKTFLFYTPAELLEHTRPAVDGE